MKIILCTFLLCITAVSVFGQSVELHGIEVQSVEFSAAVKKGGFLMYSGVTIGDSSRETPGIGKYRDRLQWDSSTGLFSLSGLREEDSGEYKVQNTDQNIAVFQLNVYIPVSKPNVSVTRDEYPCTLLCSVKEGTGVTLSWYRVGQKKPYVTSPVQNAPHLHLPVPVDEGGIYTCEAKNSVNRETSDPLTVGAHCTVSVFGQSVELNGILGKSIEFPAAVKKGGFLMYSGVTIGDSSRGTPRNERFNGRLHWDSSTGLFSLSGLKMEDIGEYKVQNTDQNITVFQLSVYKDNVPVSKPHVSITHNEYPCTIECTAERGTEATLTWYREGQKKPYSRSSVRSAPHLDLPQTVERSSTYTCEARNSVSRETSDPLTVGAHCTDGSSTGIIVASVIAAVAVLIAVVFAVLYCRFIRRFRGNGSKHSTKEGNRSKHPTKDGDAVQPVPQSGETRLELSPDGETRLELSPDARRKLIQVDKLLNDSLPAYDKKFLNEDLPAYDEEEQ